MKVVYSGERTYVLRFDPGEEIITGVKEFCRREKIKGALLWGIGACDGLTLAWYDLQAKAYREKTFNERLEIASLLGNIAQKDNEMIVHSHGVFGDAAFQTRSGHVKKLVVSATAEITLRVLEGKLTRKSDPKTGLNLLA